ncbi:hypothetical protein DWV07_14515 [Dickeya zeae]|nr:hypothetical protein [Dickeya zeae]QIZ48000.1 hypothetical protein DWV07_14515 [Dickeya zeae]
MIGPVLAEAIDHHHPVGQVVEAGGQETVGAGGVDAAPLCVVFVAPRSGRYRASGSADGPVSYS